MIKAICFDLDGVYFLNGKTNFINSLKYLGVSENEAKRVFLKSDQMNKQYKLGKMSDEEFWAWALKEWNLSLSVKEIVDLLITGYEINREAVDYVRRLRARGYKTVICSNNFPARIIGLQHKFGFLEDFDVVVLSYEVGFDKPNKEIFRELIRKANVPPDQIVYSDDDPDKMGGARELGINTFVYTDFVAFVEHLQSLNVM
ncbi:HAD family phosphatase [candidate division WWE3 bacterium]|uniref:HAD family phosphatase n=1 Tax=candidate division WWE3 bacterium TaxID=2053526 RepID=A0A7X9DKW7_UNCKA|nr:HAD family phosphatase [candidate division WWE3 bacterium]